MSRLHNYETHKSLIVHQSITAVHLIKVYMLSQKRNEWVNWDGDTNTMRRHNGIRLSLDEASYSIERMRTPGSQFVIEEAPAIHFVGPHAGLILVDFGLNRNHPLRDLTYSKKWAECRKMRSLLSFIPNLKNWQKYILVAGESQTESYRASNLLYIRNSKATGSKSKLGWSLIPKKLDASTLIDFVSKYSKDIEGYIKHEADQSKVKDQAKLETQNHELIEAKTSLKVSIPSHPTSLEDSQDNIFEHSNDIDKDVTPVLSASHETEREQLAKARIGQGLFRVRVEAISPKCLVTKVSSPEHLIASHIKSWRASNDYEKLDGNNGFLLAPHVDHLFDRGYISFTDQGDLLFTSSIDHLLKLWSIPLKLNVGEFNARQKYYLNYHREFIFKN